MASKRPFNAVLHSSAVEFLLVNALGTRILEGLYTDTKLFPPAKLSYTKSDFKTANDKLNTLIGQAKGNSQAVKDRNDQSVIVHAMLVDLLADVNKIAKHNITTIDKSGFDASNEPQHTTIPDAPVIKEVTEKKQEAGHYKVILVKAKKKALAAKTAKSHSKGNIRFTVQSATTPTADATWTTLLEGAASNKLVFTGLTANVKNYIRVYGVNSAGKGQPSAPFPFTPQ